MGASLQSRFFEWAIRALGIKARLGRLEGMRERVLKGRPKDPRPVRSVYRRFRVEERLESGRRVFTVSAKASAARVQVLYLHGGGYVAEIMDAQWKMLGKLIDRAEIAVTVPLFPLAPEVQCEEVLGFVTEVYERWARESAGLPLVVLGDSAGGGMALALAQVLRAAGKRLPEGLVLISPWLDVTFSDPSQGELERLDPILSRPSLREKGLWYAGSLAATDARVSPIFGEMDGLPPMMVLAGTHDLLFADAVRLRALVPNIRWVEGAEMMHVWPLMAIPEAKSALDEIAGFVMERAR